MHEKFREISYNYRDCDVTFTFDSVKGRVDLSTLLSKRIIVKNAFDLIIAC